MSKGVDTISKFFMSSLAYQQWLISELPSAIERASQRLLSPQIELLNKLLKL